MEYRRFGNDWLLRLDPGDELVACVKTVCEREGLTLGAVSGIGAVSRAVVGLFDLGTKKFVPNTLEMPLEIVALAGNFSTMDGRPYLHLHAALADRDARMYGGHLSEAVVSATAEIFLAPVQGKIDRTFSDEIGLNLIDFNK